MRALVSVHDVMPETLAEVEQILAKLSAAQVSPEKVYLLVVPGRQWQASQIAQLSTWQQRGYQLAGHGWQHVIRRKRGIKHQLHSLFISRNVAEHLSLSGDEISQLISDNYHWFHANGLPPPDLYVPPAWAMGAVSKAELQQLPFRYYEFSSGLFDAHAQQFLTLALTGYEADQYWRVPFLWLWNQLNVKWLSRARVLRIAIHPYDFHYHLHDSILQHISQSAELVTCTQLFPKSTQPAVVNNRA
ncbi:polysaccharide deacetylase family protein [Halioxenophilus sp. WMMB6]|uniref:polysaccharide deacetylase family protein n=1 Tax=Halioxenophilus sp. WMMB6 TaxID=3073815 RepID=UPI00295F3AB3|nr:polysaccharide deacetylase family protein [Halioxenophilus sp. WMMB6]